MPILSPTNMCLDSAHDNVPTYQLLEHWDINALIDINSRCRTSENAPKDISFDKKGHPLCRCGIEMKYSYFPHEKCLRILCFQGFLA
jgi:hypothetical protein